MKRTRHLPTALGLALGLAGTSSLAAASPAQAAAQGDRAEIDAAKALILAVVDPARTADAAARPQESATPGEASPQSDLTQAVARLIARGESNAIWGLGIGAAPALRALANTAEIEDLIQAQEATSPLLYLARVDPNGTLDYFAARLGDDIDRFKTLAFVSKGGLIDAASQMSVQDRQRTATSQLFERACLDQRLDLSFRVRLAMEALEQGIATPKTEELLLSHVAMWTRVGDTTKNLATLYVKSFGLPTSDVAPNVAQMLWGHSFEVDRALARHGDPEVRVTLARRLGNATLPIADPGIVERIPLLVERAVEETSPYRPDYFRAIEHVLRPQSPSPWLSVDLLAQLIEGSDEETALSEKLPRAIAYQLYNAVQPADSVTEAQWTKLYRAIAKGSNRRVVGTYLEALKSHIHHGAAVISYATIMVETGEFPSLDFGALVYRSDFMTPEEKAQTRLRLVQVLGHDEALEPDVLMPGKPLAALPASQLEDALRFYGTTGTSYTKQIVADANAWGLTRLGSLRELCSASDLPWRSRAIAAVGLLSTNDVSDGVLASRVLIEEATTEEQLATARLLVNARTDVMKRNRSWCEYVATLLEASQVRPDVLGALPFDGTIYMSTSDQRARIVRAAASLMDNGAARNMLSYLADHLAEWMSAEEALCNDRLILELLSFERWDHGKDRTHELALTRPEIRGQVMAALLSGIRDGGRVETLVSNILRVANEKEMDDLIRAVTESSSSKLLEYLEDRLATIARLKVAQRAWSSASKAAPSREAAIGKILGMLASEDEDVRVEVILGLSTLGAVETLPTLIEIVGSGTAREKVAAKESLALLREMAKQEAAREAKGSAPSGK